MNTSPDRKSRWFLLAPLALAPVMWAVAGHTTTAPSPSKAAGAAEVALGASSPVPATPVQQKQSGALDAAKAEQARMAGLTASVAGGKNIPVNAWADIIEAECDPRVVTDEKLRAAIKGTGLPWRIREKISGIEMLLIPPGQFVMGMSVGDDSASSDERPSHEVILTKPFYLGRTEVTQEQWTRIMGWNESYFQDFNFEAIPAEDREQRIVELIEAGYTRQQAEEKLGPVLMKKVETATWPVETVEPDSIEVFLNKAALRLPTEAEWEFACRAGTTTSRYGDLDVIAWHSGNSEGRTHPVGAKLPNGFGLYDMIGNVWEWCSDWYGSDYYRNCELGATDPKGPGPGPFRLLRGGSWDHSGDKCRASFRLNHFMGDPRVTDFGFRVARTP